MLSGEAFENTRTSCQGVLPSKGGESVEEMIKLVVAVAQLLLAIAEIIRIILERN
jgi:hypothetical protein